jgi:hypothetical protein
VTRRLASHARQTAVPAKACIVSGLHQFDEGFTREHVDFEFAAAQLFPKMLAQRLLLDAKLIGDFGLGDAKSRGVLNESALFGSRHIFGWHLPFRFTQPRDARARSGKLSAVGSSKNFLAMRKLVSDTEREIPAELNMIPNGDLGKGFGLARA